MNFHAFAPQKYKISVVSGFIHRIYRACSKWSNFHVSLEKAKQILINNQYPESFFDPIIQKTLENIVLSKTKEKITEEELENANFLYFTGERHLKILQKILKRPMHHVALFLS